LNYILTVDYGTTNVKAALVDEEGNVVSSSFLRNTLLTSPDGSAEHNPKELFTNSLKAMRSVIRGYEHRIAAIALSTYLHGLMAIDFNEDVILNVMTHLDLRAAGYEDTYSSSGYELYKRTGCPPIFVYPLPKILWLKSRGSHLVGGVKRFSFLKDYVIERLIGDGYVDYGVASGTQLFNVHSLRWDDLALSIAGIDEGKLPKLVEGAKVLDYVRDSVLSELSIVGERVPLVPATFDGGAQNFGLGAFTSNVAAVNLGSTAVLRLLSRGPITDSSRDMRFFTYYVADGFWAVGGASNNGCTAVDWFIKDILNLSTEALDEELKESRVGSDGVLFLPFLAGERFPFRSPYLRGVFYGLKLSHRRAHLIRAILEGVSFNLRVVKEALVENGVSISEVICGGGGCKSNAWREILSSMLCLPVSTVGWEAHATNRGAALIAAKALGFVKSYEPFTYSRSKAQVINQPPQSVCRAYDELYTRYMRLYMSLKEVFKEFRD